MTGCVNQATSSQVKIFPFQRDFPTLACGAAHIQRSGLPHHTAVTSVQYNAAALLTDALRPDDTTVIYSLTEQHVLSARRQLDLTITGHNQPLVFDQCIHHRTVYTHPGETRTIQ